MEIDNLTIGQIKEIQALGVTGGKTCGGSPKAFAVGEKVLIRTVTMFWIGQVVSESDKFVTLNPAAWIADTGRFHTALKTGALGEVEPAVGSARVGIGAIVDILNWNHEVPTQQK